ncbi:MAG TPA: class I SAM-dependent methyltransferase [Actinomadura sp.]|nr:class I SAM-dependent methyltransferase [Actinomadura sp.]
MGDVRGGWKTERLRAAVYDFGVRTYPLNVVAARLLWGYDVRRLWETIGLLARDPDDAAVLDLPCGGGIAFRGLPRGRRLRYVAADLSTGMLDRARAVARRRGLEPGGTKVGFVQADVGALPFPDGSFDVCVTLNGLHCFPDPAGAVAELARVLRPGGTLRGTCVVSGTGGRRDALIGLLRRRGVFGPGGRAVDLRNWLTGAGLEDVRVDVDGAVAAFNARRP